MMAVTDGGKGELTRDVISSPRKDMLVEKGYSWRVGGTPVFKEDIAPQAHPSCHIYNNILAEPLNLKGYLARYIL